MLTRAPAGVNVELAVRVRGGSGKNDILASRSAVALVRPGAAAAGAGDTYAVDYCFGPEATEQDVFARMVEPLLHRFVAGQNACLLALGASGTGKTTTFEGQGRGRPGVVHMAAKVRAPALHVCLRVYLMHSALRGTLPFAGGVRATAG